VENVHLLPPSYRFIIIIDAPVTDLLNRYKLLYTGLKQYDIKTYRMVKLRVVTAVNTNKPYVDLIPLFVYQWKKVYPDVSITILYIGDSLPTELIPYSDYIECFPPPKEIHTTYMAQTIRILYPALCEEDEMVLLTDMDMLPGDSDYFRRCIPQLTDSFLSLRPNIGVPSDQITICYVAASGKTWRSVTNIHSREDVYAVLSAHSRAHYDGRHGGSGWYTDQQLLRMYVTRWKEAGGTVIFLQDTDTGFSRLDYYHHNYNISDFICKLTHKGWSDCHLFANRCPWGPAEVATILHGLQGHNTL
jgi:hypothetical protein